MFENVNKHVTELVDVTTCTLLPMSNVILCSDCCEGSAAHSVAVCVHCQLLQSVAIAPSLCIVYLNCSLLCFLVLYSRVCASRTHLYWQFTLVEHIFTDSLLSENVSRKHFTDISLSKYVSRTHFTNISLSKHVSTTHFTDSSLSKYVSTTLLLTVYLVNMSVQHTFTDQYNTILLTVHLINMSVQHIFTDSSLSKHVTRTYFYWQFT